MRSNATASAAARPAPAESRFPRRGLAGNWRGAGVAAVGGSALLALVALGGCASLPPTLQGPVTELSPQAVQPASEFHLGVRVRWGGRILAVHNRSEVTWIEVLARPLAADGRPRGTDTEATSGRFLVELDGFIEPARYPEGRDLTVIGPVRGAETRPVGDFPYVYPVVRPTGLHLWPEPVAVDPRFDPYWYRPWPGPWYGPWYGPRHVLGIGIGSGRSGVRGGVTGGVSIGF